MENLIEGYRFSSSHQELPVDRYDTTTLLHQINSWTEVSTTFI